MCGGPQSAQWGDPLQGMDVNGVWPCRGEPSRDVPEAQQSLPVTSLFPDEEREGVPPGGRERDLPGQATRSLETYEREPPPEHMLQGILPT